MAWTRDELITVLAEAGPAEEACLGALRAGAVFLPPESDHAVPAAILVTIYERRARHLAKHGVRTIGLDDAVERLRLRRGSVSVAGVHSDDFNFVIFLDLAAHVAVSCLGVDASAANPNWDDAARAL